MLLWENLQNYKDDAVTLAARPLQHNSRWGYHPRSTDLDDAF